MDFYFHWVLLHIDTKYIDPAKEQDKGDLGVRLIDLMYCHRLHLECMIEFIMILYNGKSRMEGYVKRFLS